MLVFLPIRVLSGTDTCGNPGFQVLNEYYEKDKIWNDHTEGWVRWEGSTTHYLGLKGSYIASETGPHTFRVFGDVWSPSSESGYGFEFIVEDNSVHHTGMQCDRPWDVVKYFRYKLYMYYDTDKYSSAVQMIIVFPNGTAARISNANDGETCYESGCGDRSLSREPYACQPAPSISHTPTPTRSVSRTPSISPPASLSPSPTNEFDGPERRAGPGRMRLIQYSVFTWAIRY
jgi:hypothetical protein